MRVFIGSSSEQERLVEWITNFIQKNYAGQLEPVPWTAYWKGGLFTLEHLERLAEETDAAILFWTGDDKTWYRGTERHEPRDNLVFEAGLFFAAHDRERVQILIPDYADPDPRKKVVAIPSDLKGLTLNYFRWADGDLAATGLPHTARNVCDALAKLGSRHRLPTSLQFLRGHSEIEPVTTLVGDFRTILNDGIVKLAGSDDAKQIDILVSYRIGEVRRVLDNFRARPGGRLRACFADMWDGELLKIYQRKYFDRTDDQIRNGVKDSIQGLLGEVDFDLNGATLISLKPKAAPQANYEIRLTQQRITYSVYRIDGTVFIVPLDMKSSQNPPPLAWAFAQETAPRTYRHYLEEYERMFSEARSVYPS